MRLIPTDRERAVRAEFRGFFEEHCPDGYADRCEDEQRFPAELYAAAGQHGLFGLTLPQKYGGRGEGTVALAILLQEAGRVFPDFANLIVREALCASAIQRFASDELREQLLERFASGDIHMAFAATEPEAGSDIAALRTVAVPDGDSYVVTGEKLYATGADVADAVLCFARLPGTDRREGLLALVLRTDQEGVEIERLSTLGVRATGTAAVRLEDVEVPRRQVVGEPGGGWQVLTGGLDLERLASAAIATGAAGFLLEHVTERLRSREQYGRPLAQFQAIRHRIADLAMAVDGAELAMFRVAQRIASGSPTHVEASVAKLAATDAYMRTAHQSVQLEGGYGYTLDRVVQRHFRDAKMYEIGGGASDVQRDIIGKGLGL